MKLANINNYRVLRLYQPDVLCDKVDWKTEISDFLTDVNKTVHYVSSNPNKYKNFLNDHI